jgi:hypothetical protein
MCRHERDQSFLVPVPVLVPAGPGPLFPSLRMRVWFDGVSVVIIMITRTYAHTCSPTSTHTQPHHHTHNPVLHFEFRDLLFRHFSFSGFCLSGFGQQFTFSMWCVLKSLFSAKNASRWDRLYKFTIQKFGYLAHSFIEQYSF